MDFRYEEAARYKAQYCTVVGFDSLMGKLQELLQKHGVQEVYMECEQLSVAQARRFEEAFQKVGVQAVLDSTLDNAIRDQRMIKSPEEVKKIEASQEITDAAFQQHPALHQRGRHRAGPGLGDRVLHAQAGRPRTWPSS